MAYGDVDYGEGELGIQYMVARKAYGLALFPVTVALGAVLGFFRAKTGEDTFGAIGTLVEFALTSFLAYRTWIGRGWIAGPLLVAIDVTELAFKLFSGAINPGWALFHAAILWSVASAAWACIKIRRLEQEGHTLSEVI